MIKKQMTAFLLCVAVVVGCLSLTATAKEVGGEYIMQYLTGRDWHTFDTRFDGKFDGLKITSPAGKDYYLEYKTKNVGKTSFYSPVKSTQDDFAGNYNVNVTNISITVKNNVGDEIDSVVVMYRSKKNDGTWFPWVSNAPKLMAGIATKYKLPDSTAIDTEYSDAGTSRYAAEGFEIHIFEENEVSSITDDFVGNEATDKIDMYYSGADGVKTQFKGKVEDTVTGIWLNTGVDQKYYLTYQASVNSSWGNTVYSWEDKSAGAWPGAITRLKISAYTASGGKLNSGVVVMYRVKSDGVWLPWVSNANPDWMRAVQIKYGITGPIDTESGYAGFGGGATAIEGVEVRVFEENTSEVEIVGKEESLILKADHIYQKDLYPTGCESVSTVMALNYFGVDISVDDFIDNYLDMTNETVFDPNLYFGGDPRKSNGIGCYAPVIEKALGKALDGETFKAMVHYGKSLEELCEKYIDNGVPIIVWATESMSKPVFKTIRSGSMYWITEHCLLLVGYDSENYYFSDSLKTDAVTAYNKEDVITAYLGLGAQAVTVEKASPEKGDINADGSLDIRDLIRLKSRLVNGGTAVSTYDADLVLDGRINAADLTELQKRLLLK